MAELVNSKEIAADLREMLADGESKRRKLQDEHDSLLEERDRCLLKITIIRTVLLSFEVL